MVCLNKTSISQNVREKRKDERRYLFRSGETLPAQHALEGVVEGMCVVKLLQGRIGIAPQLAFRDNSQHFPCHLHHRFLPLKLY